MQILRRGSEGDEVRRWQRFLVGQGLLDSGADGVFGPATEKATRAFQRLAKAGADGVVGPGTYAAALQRGFDAGFTDPQGGQDGADWPPRPQLRPLVSNEERARVFGAFRYEPVGPDSDDIRILGDWRAKNLQAVVIPSLAGVKGAPASGRIWVHRLVADQLRALFAAWADAGLASRILTWEGSFAPRFVRGSRSTLSNHSWGTAFDVNYAWNKLATVPALRGAKGSVRELVPLANAHGFYWGGHFSRADGMHFEVAQLRS
ncbi:MAG TPA: M15 family metallopeptidase [Anaeromyxobacter sp.]|nr:M15 family metallopeptidase [Anaeromyxobacter sp.]